MTVEIKDRNGWKFAVVRRPRGQGRALVRSLGVRSMEDAVVLVRDGKLAQIALASAANALTREVWTRLLAGKNMRVRDTIEAFVAHREVRGDNPITIRDDRQAIDRFLRHSGVANESIAAVDAGRLGAFINAPGRTTLATRTRTLWRITGWLKFCVDRHFLVMNPAADVTVRVDLLTQDQLISEPLQAISEDDAKKLIAGIPRADFWHGAVLLGYHFGLRLGDVARLEEGNVAGNRLKIYTRKGKRVVNEAMPPDLEQWFREWKDANPPSESGLMFPAQAAAHDVSTSNLSHGFRRIAARLGIAGSFHGLRKTATANRWNNALAELGSKEQQALAKLVAENGFRAVQRLLGHAPGSPVTERSYLPRS